MKGRMRWCLAGGALFAVALLGIALAFGDTGTAAEKPEEWVRRLSDPDWRVRARAMEALRNGGEDAYKALFALQDLPLDAQFRVALLKKELAPRYGSWHQALEAGRASLDAGKGERALEFLFIAAQKNEALRADPWVADLCAKAWQRRPESSRDCSALLDWQLHLVGENGYLADHFPESALREKSLFLSGRYREVAAEYPVGVYAPLAKYSLTAGHSYFEPPKYLEIENPAKEAEEWPRFLHEHPGHPGSDDAAYRLGRAFERLGRPREAAVWLTRSASLPDGEFAWKGPLRALYVLDALAAEEDLEALAGDGHPSALREKASLTRAVRELRRGEFAGALRDFRIFVEEFPESRFRGPVELRVKDLEGILVPAAGKAAGPDEAGDALYELGRYFYHRVLSLYNPAWDNNRVKYFSYEVTCLGRSHAFDAPDYFESHNNYLKAAEYFDRLWREKRQSPRRPAALYSAGTSYLRAATLDAFSVFRRTREQLLDESAARYRKLWEEHPEDPLAATARKMIEVVKNMPRQ